MRPENGKKVDLARIGLVPEICQVILRIRTTLQFTPAASRQRRLSTLLLNGKFLGLRDFWSNPVPSMCFGVRNGETSP